MERRDIFKSILGVFAFLTASRISKAEQPLRLSFSGKMLNKEDGYTLLAIGAHSARVRVPKPFTFLNLAGQTTFPCYDRNGCPIVVAAAYLFPNKEEMMKMDAGIMAGPPMSGYSLCTHRGARYAAIAVTKQVEDWDQEIAERCMQSVVSQAIESLKNFHPILPGDHINIWAQETREEREHGLGEGSF